MRQIPKFSLRRIFHGSASQQNMEYLSTSFMSGDRETEDELYSIWNGLPESIGRKTALKAYRRFESTLPGTGRKKYFFRTFSMWSMRAAACLLLPVSALAVYFGVDKGRPEKWIEEYVAYGDKKKVVLPDSSVIWLNADSRLIYPEDFDGKLRQVFVTGEAYADIRHDAKRPFCLSTGAVDINVLGTRFNVRSYPEMSRTEVSLLEGRISLDVDAGGIRRQYMMTPGCHVSLDNATGEIETYRFVPQEYRSWSDEDTGIYFRDETLEEIAYALERMFDVRIIIRDARLKNQKYYASFVNDESLDEILGHFAMDSSFRFTAKDGVIDIYSK